MGRNSATPWISPKIKALNRDTEAPPSQDILFIIAHLFVFFHCFLPLIQAADRDTKLEKLDKRRGGFCPILLPEQPGGLRVSP